MSIEFLSKDEAEVALWQAIEAIKLGNKTDDKLILENLREAGLWIARISATQEATDRVGVLREAVDACQRIATESVCVLDEHDARVQHRGIIAGAQACIAAIRAIRTPQEAAAGEIERERLARTIDPRGWEPYHGRGYERRAWLEAARQDVLSKADAIIALRGDGA